jgi:hypothetical protein
MEAERRQALLRPECCEKLVKPNHVGRDGLGSAVLEGLEPAFNSLDAQLEACAAFILWQKREGWTVPPAPHDDGGYSSARMELPGCSSGRRRTNLYLDCRDLLAGLADLCRVVSARRINTMSNGAIIGCDK